MSLSLTEQLAEQATDALHQAIFKAWVAGYDKCLEDLRWQHERGLELAQEERHLRLVKETTEGGAS